MNLTKGQKIKFDSSSPVKVTISFESKFSNDIFCFALNENGKLINDDYMTFYNQPTTPNQEVKLTQENPTQFLFDFSKIDYNISKFVLTLAVSYGINNVTLKDINSININFETTTESYDFVLNGSDFYQEKSIMLIEIYKKDEQWRINCFGQGFEGGMEKLVSLFGGIVDNKSSLTTSKNNLIQSVDKSNWLEKRLSLEKNLEQEAPKLLHLSKKAALSLQKYGLEEHRAKVALCLDISASMSGLYSSGLVQSFVEKILALGCRLDDDGAIDIFLFGADGYQPDPVTYKDFNGYVNRIVKQHPLESDTKYSTAIEMVRSHYTDYKYERSEPLKLELPVYVMFLTDGKPSDKTASTRALKNSSFEPIFWQFMGVGQADFSYLEKLDDLTDRYIDNADFFSASSLTQYNDEQLYAKLINEYPTWLKEAASKGLL
jgi:stress response protein SCP2/uncharacterized protein YegL